MTDIPLFILYGSATGNGESIAKDLAGKYKDQLQLPSPFTKVECYEANDFKKKCLPIWANEPPQDIARKYGLIFVTSTTGNGDSPENASRFIRHFKRKATIESLPLKHVAFAVLALGDTNYDMFCENGKVADRKMLECGGERAKSLGMADEGTGLEDVVDAWVEDIVPILAKACQPVSVGGVHQEEKKTEEIAPVVAQPGSRPNVATLAGRPNVQSILNLRLGIPAAAPPVGSRPNVPMVGSRPNLPSAVQPKVQVPIAVASTTETEKKVEAAEIKSPSPLFILYGSATGNGEHIAKTLTETYEKMLSTKKEECYFPEVVCCELDQYKKKCVKTWDDDSGLNNDVGQKHGVLIISSTTGNGEAPENASRFVRYIKRKNTVDTMPFKHVAYSVLGLGDTNYDQFCEMGKVIDKKLKDLGGTRVQKVACADEGTGLEQVVDPWVENIFAILSKGCKGVETSYKGEEEKSDAVLPTQATTLEPTVEKKALDMNTGIAKCTMSLPGVSIISQLLEKNTIPEVDVSLLPSLGTSLSSCELYNEDEPLDRRSSRGMSLSELERMTVSSAGSSNIHYTSSVPFQSAIVGARYLTETNTQGAKLACDVLDCTQSVDGTTQDDNVIRAMKHLQDSFPLVGQNSEEQKQCERNGKRVIELKLSLPDDFTLEYQPGDSIGLSVSNSAEATKFVLEMLNKIHGISFTQKVSLDAKQPITIAAAVGEHIDLCSPIKNKRLLLALAQFATDVDEANALKLLASKDPVGQDLFKRYIDEQRISVVDILKQFPSCQSITLKGLLSILPGIPPRYYSVSSSPLGQKDDSLHLTVAFSVVDYTTPSLSLKDGTRLQRRVGGLATTYLEAVCAPYLSGATDIDSRFATVHVKIFPKPTADFRLPVSLSTPMILIGPGTGVAPFIGFLKHREAQFTSMDSTKVAKEVSEGTWRGGFDFEEEELPVSRQDAKGLVMGADYRSDQRFGDIALYYGCRYRDHDWLYKAEMQSLEKSGIVSHLNVAFSRDNGASKCYVQDKLRNDAESIVKMVTDNKATIYICGDGNAMAKDVQNALVEIFAKHSFSSSGDATQQAKAYVEDLKSRNKLVLDIWS